MTLFVGHINERIKDQILHELFSPYGKISIIDRKGTYAFVEYEGPADTTRAVQELNKMEIMGTVLRVELSNRIRGELGPPPGDLTEICYNCQKIGHIAKNCLLPPVIMQRQQQQQQQQNMLFQKGPPPPLPPLIAQQQQYQQQPQHPFIAVSGSTAANRQPPQRARLSKREGFLDRNPQNIRLNKLGNPRMRSKPYTHPTHGSPTKKSATWLQTPGTYDPRNTTAEARSLQRQEQQQKSTMGSSQSPLDFLYAAGMHSSLAQGITQMAGPSTASFYPSSPDTLSPNPLTNKPNDIYSQNTGPAVSTSLQPILPEHVQDVSSLSDSKQPFYSRLEHNAHAGSSGHNLGATSTSHSYMHPANAQLVENPFLPPGTLIYMPMITVLPGTQARQQQQQQQNQQAQQQTPTHHPPFSSALPPMPPLPPPRQIPRSASTTSINPPFSAKPSIYMAPYMPKRRSLQPTSAGNLDDSRDNHPQPAVSEGKGKEHALTSPVHESKTLSRAAFQRNSDDTSNNPPEAVDSSSEQVASGQSFCGLKDKS